MFDSTKERLLRLLENVDAQRLQLPDFQRDWVWDDDAIRSLLASILSVFPVGAVLTLEAGGSVDFAPRPLATIGKSTRSPDEFLLDGQQRLTSLYQALFADRPVVTKTAKGAQVQRLYFVDLKAATRADGPAETWILGLPGDGIERTDFGRRIVHDLSTPERQFEQHAFPLNKVFREHDWLYQYRDFWHGRGEDIHQTHQALIDRVIRPIHGYEMPVIRLGRGNSREAICTVFEKVNTGGKKLDAFELLTAIFAAERFNLREDWLGEGDRPGRLDRLRNGPKSRDVFANLASTDFLQACTLLHTMAERERALRDGRTGKDLPMVTIRRDAMLSLPLAAYRAYADRIEDGLKQAKSFFSARRIIWEKDVPYPTQAITLAAVFASLDPRERTAAADDKLDEWFWCGVLGELYSSVTETRIARDAPELIAWIRGASGSPQTIGEAIFQDNRFDTLRSRLAAAYKGIHALLMREGCQDFISGEPTDIMTFFDRQMDIHHVFPAAWCKRQGIPPAVYNRILNKTPLSRLSNVRIGGDAPSVYLRRIEQQDGIPAHRLDAILRTHLIDPTHLRHDDFEAFMTERRIALGELVARAMRKPIALGQGSNEAEAYDDQDQEEEAA